MTRNYKLLAVLYATCIVACLFYIGTYTEGTEGTEGTESRYLLDIDSRYTNIQCSDATIEGSIVCGSNAECVAYNSTLNICGCNKCYTNDPLVLEPCSISSIPALTLLLIVIFVGECGVGHCFASGCTCPGVCIGILKALTAGGLGIWWICDIVFAADGSWNERYPYSNPICEW